jgi:hypothetical protein
MERFEGVPVTPNKLCPRLLLQRILHGLLLFRRQPRRAAVR